jgi:hypothetical protein
MQEPRVLDDLERLAAGRVHPDHAGPLASREGHGLGAALEHQPGPVVNPPPARQPAGDRLQIGAPPRRIARVVDAEASPNEPEAPDRLRRSARRADAVVEPAERARALAAEHDAGAPRLGEERG